MGVPIQTAQPTGYLMTSLRLLGKDDLIFPNEYWTAIVKDYTRSNLTYDSDKLSRDSWSRESNTTGYGCFQ